jgi:hypothetical protein
MKTASISALAGAALIAAMSGASAGPMNVVQHGKLIAPQETQIEQVHYKKKKHHHRRTARTYRRGNPGRAVVGTAGGLAGVGVNAAVGTAHTLERGWCDFWGYCR